MTPCRLLAPERHAALPQNFGRFRSKADIATVAPINGHGANDPEPTSPA
jgi:hypothetical protein